MADDTIAKIGIDVDVTGAKEAGDQLDNLGKKGKKAEGGLKDVAKGANKTNGPFRAMRGSVQQVSWQLQDVQAQMGTSMFTILGQQGPQLASIFGPGGAVVGAFIAFGAMAAGVLYTTLSGASKLTKELTKETENLYEKTDELNGALKELAMLQAAKRQEELKKAITEATAAMEVSKTVIASVALGAVVWDETLKKANETVITQNGIIAVSNKALGELAQQNDGVSAATEKLSEKLREELLELQLTEEQFLRYKAAQGGATAAQIEGIVAAQALIDAEKEKAKALEDAAKALEKSKEELASYSEGLYHQLAALHLSGDALYYYQAALKGGTAEQIAANAELLKSIALRKEKIKADADAVKAQAKADADAVKARRKAEADALNQGDSARSLLEEIALENMTELEQLEAHLIKKGGLLFQYLEEGHITLDQYLAMDAELQATYDLAEVKAKQDLSDKLLEIEAKRLEDNKTYLQEWFEQTEETLMNIDAASVTVAEGMESGFADAFGSFLDGTATAEDAMKNLVVSVGQNMAQMIADMIAQWMAYHIMQAIVGKTTQASEATAMSLNAVAMSQMAGLAAFASTAAIPIVGPAAAPAAMLAALAITTPVAAGISALSTMAVAARAQGGQVRGGESYLVGERGPELLTMGTSGRIASNDSLKNAVGGNSGADVVVNQTINVTTGIQSTVRAEIIQLMPQIAQAAKGAVADGRLRGGNFSKVMSGA
jgi:hypothetical protein